MRGDVLCRSRQLLSRILGIAAAQIYTGRAVTRGVLDGELIGHGPRNGQLKAGRQIAAVGGEGGGAQALGNDLAEVLFGGGVYIVLHRGHILVTDLPGDGGVGAFLRLELSADRGGIGAAEVINRQCKLFACKLGVGGSPHQLEAGDLRLRRRAGNSDAAGFKLDGKCLHVVLFVVLYKFKSIIGHQADGILTIFRTILHRERQC